MRQSLKASGIIAGVVLAGLLLAATASATFRGTNGEISFVAGSPFLDQAQLVSSAPNGNRFRQVLPARYKVRDVAVSPDGRRIAFSATTGVESPEIFVASRDGRGIRKLTNRGGADQYYRQPAWSADGRRIAYAVFGLGSNRGIAIRVMRADGTGKRNLFQNPALDFFVEDPVFSPNGRRLAYTRFVRQNPIVSEIYSVNAVNGSGERRLTDGLGSLNSYGEPDYRPNGRVILVRTAPPFLAGRTRIARVNATAGNSPATTLIESPLGWAYGSPQYSPDGARMIFAGEDLLADPAADRHHLFTAAANGTGIRKLSLLFEAVVPTWGARPRR
ncbi:MAG: TolB protein [Actinomycetota bacterium]|jgi:TolB protein|nr:TolB protein [Actinomycetota bacterium]